MARQQDDQDVDDGLDPEVIRADSDDGGDQSDDSGESDDGGQQAPVAAKPVATQKPDGGVQVRVAPPKAPRQAGSPNRPSKFVSRRELDEAKSNFERKIRELQEARSAPAGQPGGQPPASPADQELTQISGRMNQILAAAQEEMAPAARQALMQEFNSLAKRQETIKEEKLTEKLWARFQGELQNRVPNAQAQAHTGAIAREFPELVGNKLAARTAQIYYDQAIEDGQEDSLDLMREAAAYAYKANGLGGKTRGRMGSGATQGAPGGSRGGEPNGGQVFDFNPEMTSLMGNYGITPEQVAAYEAERRRNGG